MNIPAPIGNTTASDWTRHALQQRLATALDCNEQLRQEIRSFANTLSHDFGAPIRATAGFSQLLLDEIQAEQGDKVNQYGQRILDGAENLKRLNQGLNTLARVTSMEPLFAEVDLSETLERTVSLLGTLDRADSIAYADLPTLIADSFQMQQLFTCLLENALQFRKPTPLRVSIGASETDTYWQLSVCDNGIGIHPRHQELAFMMYRKLNPNSFSNGLGMGLTICRYIVVIHGGKIWIESAEGDGCTVHINLPKLPPAYATP